MFYLFVFHVISTEKPDKRAHRITPSFTVLFRHFFAVAFYSIWVMFTHPQPVLDENEKITYVAPGWDAYPYLLVKSLQVVRPLPFLPRYHAQHADFNCQSR